LPVTERRFQLFLRTALASSNYLHRVTSTVLQSSTGLLISAPYYAEFRGVIPAEAIVDRYRPFDLASTEIVGGSLKTNEARGYAEDVVSLALEKYFLLQDLGVAPEEARIVLPLNTMTTVTWTGSLLFWSRVCNQRVDSHAQKAAQELGKKISDIAQPLFPTSWAALVG
jgi:thymidylate synthase ThyX